MEVHRVLFPIVYEQHDGGGQLKIPNEATNCDDLLSARVLARILRSRLVCCSAHDVEELSAELFYHGCAEAAVPH